MFALNLVLNRLRQAQLGTYLSNLRKTDSSDRYTAEWANRQTMPDVERKEKEGTDKESKV